MHIKMVIWAGSRHVTWRNTYNKVVFQHYSWAQNHLDWAFTYAAQTYSEPRANKTAEMNWHYCYCLKNYGIFTVWFTWMEKKQNCFAHVPLCIVHTHRLIHMRAYGMSQLAVQHCREQCRSICIILELHGEQILHCIVYTLTKTPPTNRHHPFHYPLLLLASMSKIKFKLCQNTSQAEHIHTAEEAYNHKVEPKMLF